MRDYTASLKKFLNNQLSPEETQKLLSDLKKFIKKVFKTSFSSQIENLFIKFYGEKYLEVLVHELLLNFLSKRNYLMRLEFINEKYISSSAKNLICYLLSSDFKVMAKEVNFEDLKILKNLDNEEESIKFEETLPKYVVDYFETLKTNHVIEVLKEKLTSRELKVLCWYIYKQIYQKELELNMSKAAIYKTWERLKPKLKQILAEEFDGEISSSKIFELIKSEICEKLSY